MPPKNTFISELNRLENRKDYAKAIELCLYHPDLYKDSIILLSLAKCYQKQHLFSEALMAYEIGLDCFIYDLDIKQGYVKLLMLMQHPKTLEMIQLFLNQRPGSVHLYLLEAEYYLQAGEFPLFKEKISQILYRYPKFQAGQMTWVDFLIRIREFNEAISHLKISLNRFHFSKNIFYYVHQFEKKIPHLRQSLAGAPFFQIALPQVFIHAFSFLPNGLMCGDAVIRLLSSGDIDSLRHLDFVTNHPLQYPYLFYKSDVGSEYFSNDMFWVNGQVKLICEKIGVGSENLFQKDWSNKDFTIDALYLNERGVLSCPSSLGFNDLRNKILRTCHFPTLYLREKPAAMIRALFYLAQGFKACDELVYALHSIDLDFELHMPSIYQISQDILQSRCLIDFIRYLKIYRFDEKIFKLNPHLQLHETMAQFILLVRKHQPIKIVQCHLPLEILEGFRMLPESFLVGSAIHNILEGRGLHHYQDMDFVTPYALNTCSHLMPCPYNARLYSSSYLFINGIMTKMDCYQVDYLPQELIEQDVKTRDFTITAMYVDAKGVLFDPTGLGLHDFHKKILRTVSPAKVFLEGDAIRVLRALKWIARGYIPEVFLSEALLSWQNTSTPNHGHIHSLTCKILRTTDVYYFLDLLKSYQLLNKLFDLDASLANDELVPAFQARIGFRSSPAHLQHGFFKRASHSSESHLFNGKKPV